VTSPLTVVPVPATGPEDVLVDDDGAVWTGTEDGGIFRLRDDGRRIERVGHTGGRPLGLEWLPDGRLLVCDAHRGLLAMDRVTGAIEPLVTEVEGRPMVFCNNAAVSAAGDIWFSDSSRVHPIERWKDDFVQDTRTGRLLCRRTDGSVEVLLDGLAFANGVALTPDESAVWVAQTVTRDILRLALAGPRAGRCDVVVSELPGYPDNIALGSDGLIWVTIASPFDPVVDRIQRSAPLVVRRLVTRIPEALQPKPRQTARVQAYDAQGSLVNDIDADASAYHMVTGVREHEGRVWMGSLVESAVAVADVG